MRERYLDLAALIDGKRASGRTYLNADEALAIQDALWDAANEPEALAAATRVRVVDEWRVLYANGNEGFTRFTPEEAQRVADEDNQNYPGCGARVVRVALVDFNYPATPESSERVSNAYQLSSAEQEALDALRRNPTVNVHGYSGTLLLNIIDALTAALEVPRE